MIVVVGLSHRTAPVEVREKLALSADVLPELLARLSARPELSESMFLSTCNRVEVFAAAPHAEGLLAATRAVREVLAQQGGATGDEAMAPYLYERTGQAAVRHIFRVAASLDSMVMGEPQILGQVKQSWTVGREVGAVKTTLDPLLQRAFSVAKKVRTETQIGNTTVSVASVAAELARKIFGSLSGKTVLLVGAGKMSDLTARHLIQQGATTLLVANRTEAKAQSIADALRTPAITTGVIPLDQLHQQAHRADIVITSTGAGQVFTPESARAVLQRRKNRPVFFIDIAVPRDVAPEVNKVDGCFVYDIDDLQQVAMQNKAVRNREAEAAESIVTREVARYSDRISQAPVTESIKELLLSAEEVRQQEIARTIHQLAREPLTPDQLAAIDRLTKSLTGKLLHSQISALREMAAERESDDQA